MQHPFLFQRGSPWQTEVRTAPVITRRASELFLVFPTGVWVRGRSQEQGWLKCSCLIEKPVLTRVTMNLSCVLEDLCIIYKLSFPSWSVSFCKAGEGFLFCFSREGFSEEGLLRILQVSASSAMWDFLYLLGLLSLPECLNPKETAGSDWFVIG